MIKANLKRFIKVTRCRFLVIFWCCPVLAFAQGPGNGMYYELEIEYQGKLIVFDAYELIALAQEVVTEKLEVLSDTQEIMRTTDSNLNTIGEIANEHLLNKYLSELIVHSLIGNDCELEFWGSYILQSNHLLLSDVNNWMLMAKYLWDNREGGRVLCWWLNVAGINIRVNNKNKAQAVDKNFYTDEDFIGLSDAYIGKFIGLLVKYSADQGKIDLLRQIIKANNEHKGTSIKTSFKKLFNKYEKNDGSSFNGGSDQAQLLLSIRKDLDALRNKKNNSSEQRGGDQVYNDLVIELVPYLIYLNDRLNNFKSKPDVKLAYDNLMSRVDKDKIIDKYSKARLAIEIANDITKASYDQESFGRFLFKEIKEQYLEHGSAGEAYPNLAREIEELKLKYSVADVELARWMREVLDGKCEISNLPDELRIFLANLTAIWFGAEAARNSLTTMTSFMLLDLIESEINFFGKESNWYTFGNSLKYPDDKAKDRLAKDLYGFPVKNPVLLGGSHPMAHGGSFEQGNNRGEKAAENTFEKRHRLNIVHQKEGHLIIHWLANLMNKPGFKVTPKVYAEKKTAATSEVIENEDYQQAKSELKNILIKPLLKERLSKTTNLLDGSSEVIKKLSSQQDFSHNSIGQRTIEGWKLRDVAGDGNCLFHAIAFQLNQLRENNQIDEKDALFQVEDTPLHQLLRLYAVEERDGVFIDGAWAGDEELQELARRLNLVFAIVDTRYPGQGYQYRFWNTAERRFQIIFEWNEVLQGRTIIRLAYTGNHFLAVVGEPDPNANALVPVVNNGDDPQAAEINPVAEALDLAAIAAVAEGENQPVADEAQATRPIGFRIRGSFFCNGSVYEI